MILILKKFKVTLLVSTTRAAGQNRAVAGLFLPFSSSSSPIARRSIRKYGTICPISLIVEGTFDLEGYCFTGLCPRSVTSFYVDDVIHFLLLSQFNRIMSAC